MNDHPPDSELDAGVKSSPQGAPAVGDAADAAEVRRIWWRSRRGLRELDILLQPFVEDAYGELDATQRATYLRLIACEDTELLEWFTRRSEPAEPEFLELIEHICRVARARGPVS